LVVPGFGAQAMAAAVDARQSRMDVGRQIRQVRRMTHVGTLACMLCSA
jgi:hypothetical protein